MANNEDIQITPPGNPAPLNGMYIEDNALQLLIHLREIVVQQIISEQAVSGSLERKLYEHCTFDKLLSKWQLYVPKEDLKRFKENVHKVIGIHETEAEILNTFWKCIHLMWESEAQPKSDYSLLKMMKYSEIAMLSREKLAELIAQQNVCIIIRSD